jgi:hypothetical protein
MPFTLHATVVFAVPVTTAVKDCVPPRNTAALEGIMLTLIVGTGGGDDDPVLPHPASRKAKATAALAAACREFPANLFRLTPALSSGIAGEEARHVPIRTRVEQRRLQTLRADSTV